MTLDHRLALAFLDEQPAEAARVLERLSPGEREAVLRLSPTAAAGALREMPAASAADCLSRLPWGDARAVLVSLPADVAVSLLRRLPPAAAEGLLEGLPLEESDPLRRTLQYAAGTAGALMDPDVFALPEGTSVAEARLRLRRAPHGVHASVYVVDRDRRLTGAIDLADLLRAGARATLAGVMQSVETLSARMPEVAVRSHPGWRLFHTMPVVDDEERLIGVIRYRTIRRLEREAQAAGGSPPVHVTVTALGELFHLGLASFVEGVAAVSAAGPAPVARPGAPPAASPAERERDAS